MPVALALDLCSRVAYQYVSARVLQVSLVAESSTSLSRFKRLLAHQISYIVWATKLFWHGLADIARDNS